MTPQIIEKTKQILKGARSMGLLSADEAGQIINALKATPDEVIDDRSISRPELAQRWGRSTRQISNMEKAGKLQRLGIFGHPRYGMRHILNIEGGT